MYRIRVSKSLSIFIFILEHKVFYFIKIGVKKRTSFITMNS